MDDVAIVGAGPVGAVLSVFLAQAGFRVHIYEKRNDPRLVKENNHRSINITLSERGLRVLRSIGVEDCILQKCMPAYGRTIHTLEGQLLYQPYSDHNDALFCICRQDLHRTLVSHADSDDRINFYFNEKCTDIDLTKATLKFVNSKTNAIAFLQIEPIFAADGTFSIIRQKMLREIGFNYSQSYLNYGYKELRIPPDVSGKWQLFENAIHIWPRGKLMLTGFANLDGSFTLSCWLPSDGTISYTTIHTDDDYVRLFETYFSDIFLYVKPHLSEYIGNPTSYPIEIKCFPWVFKNKVALIGDSCHTMYPFYGQGVNAGFEDCQVLAQCIERSPACWSTILKAYQAERKPNTDAITDLAAEHFSILSNQSAQPEFQIRTKIEKKIQKLFPQYTSLYNNIAFSSMPYSKAYQMERETRKIVDTLMAMPEILENLENDSLDKLLFNLASSYFSSVAKRSNK